MVTWTVKPTPESQKPPQSRGSADWQLLQSGQRVSYWKTKQSAKQDAKGRANHGDTIKTVSKSGRVKKEDVEKAKPGVDNFFDNVL